jgi:hypothetical protein
MNYIKYLGIIGILFVAVVFCEENQGLKKRKAYFGKRRNPVFTDYF